MKIAIIGATGYVGSKILVEALARGHHVTAIQNRGNNMQDHEFLKRIDGDATDVSALSRMVAGNDVVISAFNPGLDKDGKGTQSIIDGVKKAGVARLLVVGGAGTLLHPAGGRVLDQADFPSEWKQGSLRTAAFLEQLRLETDLDWVFLSPAAALLPGVRTGIYRVGKDSLLVDTEGHSRISLEDYAIAMLDEVENPQWHRERFTVAY